MLVWLAVKLGTLAWASTRAAKARSVIAAIAIAGDVAGWILGASIALVAGAAVLDAPWILMIGPALATVATIGGVIALGREVREMPEMDPRRELLDAAWQGIVLAAVLDAGALAITVLAAWLAGRSAF